MVFSAGEGKIMTSATHHVHGSHDHMHTEGCGHLSFPHGDHTDYVHDGHIHRAHEGHYDECEPAAGEHRVRGGHEHVHGDGCGHVAVPHGDHVDYLHDGGRHAAHGDHYDEH
jgi:hypothetical protein